MKGRIRMLVLFLLFLLLVPPAANAQNRGVRFERRASWQEVQARARTANKYLLVLVCAPGSRSCQAVDSLFAQDPVGTAVNEKFIAVKVRGDTSQAIPGDARDLYIDAPELRQYGITSFPTFLFFAPGGKLVHRAVGGRDVAGLLALAADARDPAKQYYVQLERYERGAKDYSVMVYLARTALALGDSGVARRVARDYIDHLRPSDRYTSDNIRFIGRFTERSGDPGFAMFVQHSDTIDRSVGITGYAHSIADRVITAEEINPLVFRSGKPTPTVPDWTAISAAITRKYGLTYAERTVLNAQIRRAYALENWTELTGYTVRKLERYRSSLDSDDINRLTWDLFLYSDDQQALAKAITWMEPVAKAVEQNPATSGFFGPAYIDTYANLLYKMGRTAEAIVWEEKAVNLSPKGFLWETHMSVLAKMKRGEPTWPQERE